MNTNTKVKAKKILLKNGFSKEPLEIGQRVWIETRPIFIIGEPTLTEYEVVKANNSSAYIVSVKDLERGTSNYSIRVDQRSKRIMSRILLGYEYTLWANKEAYLEHESKMAEMKELVEKAHEKIEKMTFHQLKEFVEQ